MSELSQKAQGQWRAILPRLGVEAQYLKNKHGPCPICQAGKDRFRFDDRDGRGTWICNQCGAGDGVKLLQLLHGWDFKQVAHEVESVLGAHDAPKPAGESQKRDPRPLLRRIAKAAQPAPDGGEVERYLTSRGLRIPDGGIKQHQGLAYYRDGKRNGTYPAMLALVQTADGKPATYHVTYLQDGKKAPLTPARKVMPPVEPLQGSAVRLFKPGRVLGIAEGIETAIAATMLFRTPTWAVLNTSGIKSFEPPFGVDEVVIYADNDSNSAGQAAAYQTAHRLNQQGIRCSVKVPPVADSDWNDWLLQHPPVAEICEGFDAVVEFIEQADEIIGTDPLARRASA